MPLVQYQITSFRVCMSSNLAATLCLRKYGKNSLKLLKLRIRRPQRKQRETQKPTFLVEGILQHILAHLGWNYREGWRMAEGARRLELDQCSRKSGTATTSGVAAELLILDLGCRCNGWEEFSTRTASLHICFQFLSPRQKNPTDEAEVRCSPYRVGRRDTWYFKLPWHKVGPAFHSDSSNDGFHLLPKEGGSFIEQTKTKNVSHNVDKN